MTRINAVGPFMPADTRRIEMIQQTNHRPELPALSRAERNIAITSDRHCTAHLVLGDGAGIRMQAESELEVCHLLLLNARQDVQEVREQVYFTYGTGKHPKHHIFDAYVTLIDGRRIACTVKYESQLGKRQPGQMPGEDFLSHMQTVAALSRDHDFADEVRLLTDADVDPVDLHNAKVIAAVREPDREADTIVWNMTRDQLGGRSLYDLTVQSGLEQRGYKAALRLIRIGALIGQPGQRLTPKTLVYRKGTIQ